MLVETTTNVTDVHTEARTGLVWVAEGDRRPAPTGLDAYRFAAAAGPGPLRVLGTRGNVPLVAALCRRPAEQGRTIHVGRPPSSPWNSIEAEGPGQVLLTMREYASGPSSLGCWHPLRPRERGAYVLTDLVDSGLDDPAALRAAMAAHPAWPALRFVPGVDAMYAAALLAEIVDPRWFDDHRDPGRPSRLRAYLGLTPNPRRTSSSAREARRELVMACWSGDGPAAGGFLWRHREARLAALVGTRRRDAPRSSPEEAADLAASRLFLAFLEGTWREAVGPPPRIRPGCGIRGDQGVFVADIFFDDPADAAAYRRHRDAIST